MALRLEDGRLVGRFDQGAINPDTIHKFPWQTVDVVAWCLSEEDTKKVYGDAARELRPAQPVELARRVPEFPYPGTMAPYVFPAAEVRRLNDSARRVKRFEELLRAAQGTTHLLFVPFMPTAEAKGELYRAFIPPYN